MRVLLSLILFFPLTLYCQLDNYEESYKRQLQLGKIDKSKTEFFESDSGVYSNFKYGFSYRKPKGWDYDNGTGLITVFRTMVIDSGISLSVNVLELSKKINPSIHDVFDELGFEEQRNQTLNQIDKNPTYYNIEKTFFRNLPTLKTDMRFLQKEDGFEFEMSSIVLQFWKKNLLYSISLNLPFMFYELNPSYYEGLFKRFYFVQNHYDIEFIDDNKFIINNKDFRKINTFDLKSMVNMFLDDCKINGISIPNEINISSTFEVLESKILGVSLGMDNDDVIIKIDPESWSKSSEIKKWYLIYHELGHDVLNLKHGEGGKMMFTFSDREYKWEEFFEDKEYMFKYFKNSN